MKIMKTKVFYATFVKMKAIKYTMIGPADLLFAKDVLILTND